MMWVLENGRPGAEGMNAFFVTDFIAALPHIFFLKCKL
jgi:hypothetical protein